MNKKINEVVAALLTIAATAQGNQTNVITIFDEILKNLEGGNY